MTVIQVTNKVFKGSFSSFYQNKFLQDTTAFSISTSFLKIGLLLL